MLLVGRVPCVARREPDVSARLHPPKVLENHPHLFDPFALASIAGLSYDKPFLWVEHYEDGGRGTPSDPATFDLVEFSHYEVRGELRAGQWAKEIGSPLWKRLDRANVEALIGGPV
jgi:hypothetical protein